MQELTGATIGSYHLQRRLARGGMSEIYLASDSQTQHTVAIKLVHSSNNEYCERFKREIKAVEALSHDHILPAFAAGDFGNWCYLVMPYIEYGTLDTKLADGPLSLREAGIILEQLSNALQHAHDQGIIHRDIKPTNILLRDGEHVYLADFGLTRKVGEDNGLTVTGYLIGTPEYMAPELAEEPASTSSDLYALGILLYKILTGHLPFAASTPIGTLLRHIKERPQPPSTLNPAIPEQVDEVILRALEKEPGHRYKSVREFAQAYWQALHSAERERATEQTHPLKPVKSGQPVFALISGHLARPRRELVLALVAAFIFCMIVPFVLGLSPNSNTASIAQPVRSRTNTVLKKTSPPVAPSSTKTPTPTRSANQSKTTTKSPTTSAPSASSAPSQYYEHDDGDNSQGKHGHGKGPEHSDHKHGKSQD